MLSILWYLASKFLKRVCLHSIIFMSLSFKSSSYYNAIFSRTSIFDYSKTLLQIRSLSHRASPMSRLVVNLNFFQSKLSKVKCQIFSIVDVPWPYHPGHIRSDFLQLHLAYQRLIGTSCRYHPSTSPYFLFQTQ